MVPTLRVAELPAAKNKQWAQSAKGSIPTQSVGTINAQCAKRQEKTTEHLGARVPVRRPSGGVAQGDEPHGCGERLKGPWMALVSRPPERHRKEGSLAAGQTRMSGCAFFCLLFFAQTKKSEAP